MPSLPTPLQRSRWNSDGDHVDLQYRQMDKPPSNGWFTGRKGVIIKLLLLVLFFIMGLMAGYLIRRNLHEPEQIHQLCPGKQYKDYDPKHGPILRQFISAQSLQNTLRNLTQHVHLAGRHENNVLADSIHDNWINYGVDSVRLDRYRVLLSYPDIDNNPNRVYVLDDSGKVRVDCNSTGVRSGAELYAYNAFAPNATVEGDLVYAYYGQQQDYELLESKHNITVKDCIVIIRYGRGFRGDKIQEATKRGAKGVILFTDPKDFALEPEKVWPNGWWIPGDAVQMGTIRHDGGGDPLTPNNPSVVGAYRLPENRTDLPTIPVQPIGYDDAKLLLQDLAGPIETKWKGSIPEVDYALGPGFKGTKSNWKVKVVVNNFRESVNITNVIGVIRGVEEPDRYVIVGNHRDAWNAGALDPSGGTAVLNELVKAFGSLKASTGWQPRRSIIFANWDAEEFGLIGSFEWMEQFEHDLVEKAVAYINMDSPLKGNFTFAARSSPMLKDVIYAATKKVPCSLSDCAARKSTVYEDWTRKSDRQTEAGDPSISYLGAGSDQTSFLHEFGIPSMYPGYYFDSKVTKVFTPPFYHTKYDTFEMVARFMDPTFEAHHTYTDVISEIILQLSETAKLTLNSHQYVDTLQEALKKVKEVHSDTFNQQGISLDYLEKAIKTYEEAESRFRIHFANVNPTDELELRRVNDILMRVSRAFITPRGLPGRPQIRNVLLAPSSHNWYTGSVFPGIEDAIAISTETGDWEIVKEQVSIMMLAIQSAASILLGGISGL
ncbi:putative N-acetylated-alpha-linked acidic dipeptidase isoform X2 [Tubulanus polymorphus]